MADLTYAQIGSSILNRISNVPSSVSGIMLQLIDDQKVFIEQYTGLSVGSPTVTEKFIPPIMDLTCAQVLSMAYTEGLAGLSLGDFSTSDQSNINQASQNFKNMGMEKLQVLGKKVRYMRVIGGN